MTIGGNPSVTDFQIRIQLALTAITWLYSDETKRVDSRSRFPVAASVLERGAT